MRKRYPFVFSILLGLTVLATAGEKVLYEKDSPYNHIVVTEDELGLRYLLFEKDGALQSVVKVGDPGYLDLPYTRAFLVGLAFVEEPRRVLIVGLGGGTIPSFLRKYFPKMIIDVVDIDPDVVNVAKRFFGFREDNLMRARVDDGRHFIETSKERYDVVFLDAYDRDNIPYHLATREFLQAVRRILTPKGVVVGNVWSRYSNPFYDSMARTYQDVFEEFVIFDVVASGNKIMVGVPRKEKIDRDVLVRRAQAISRKQKFPYDMGNIVVYGYQYATDSGFDGAVLTDGGDGTEEKESENGKDKDKKNSPTR